MIQVITKYPVALDSPDHLHPWGTIRDNTSSSAFWESIRSIRPGKLSYLDLGCAGGGLVVQAIEEYGHSAVGLEGSDYWAKHSDDLPDSTLQRATLLTTQNKGNAGEQWKKYYNQNLFTCDISRTFSIFESGALKQFDMITAWEVLEHLPEERLPILFESILRHLSNGIFLGTISTVPDRPEGFDLHQTVRPPAWWQSLFNRYFSIAPWVTSLIPARFDNDSGIFLLRKK